MTNAAPDTLETRAEVDQMTASRVPVPTMRRHAGEPPAVQIPELAQADELKVVFAPFFRFSDTCFLDVDNQPTCDACRPGYTGRRCEK